MLLRSVSIGRAESDLVLEDVEPDVFKELKEEESRPKAKVSLTPPIESWDPVGDG